MPARKQKRWRADVNIKIDKGIPFPDTRTGPKPGLRSAFIRAAEAMAIGDSVFFRSKADADALRVALSITGFGAYREMRQEMIDGNMVLGYRVWKKLSFKDAIDRALQDADTSAAAGDSDPGQTPDDPHSGHDV